MLPIVPLPLSQLWWGRQSKCRDPSPLWHPQLVRVAGLDGGTDPLADCHDRGANRLGAISNFELELGGQAGTENIGQLLAIPIYNIKAICGSAQGPRLPPLLPMVVTNSV